MKEKQASILKTLKTAVGKVNKTVRTLIISTVVLSAVIAAAYLIFQATRPYSVLFTDLTADEMSSIMTYLEDSGVADYRTEGSDTILVKKEQETQLKAKLIMEGYPSSGFAYATYIDNVGTLSTESDRQTAFLFELQDRMGAVIKCLDGVKNAWVTIAQGEDRRYVLDSSNTVDATASIMVEMRDGMSLSTEQAAAIRNLVAHAVSGLNIDSVSISDTLGNTYNTEDGTGNLGSASQLKLALEEQVNNSVRSSVMQALIPFFGQENVKVSVTSTVDVNHTTGESTTYTQPEEEGIIGSKIYDSSVVRSEADTAGDTEGGVAGTETNSDVTSETATDADTYVGNEVQADGTEKTISSSGQVDYNVNKSSEQVERTAGIVSNLMVSVSINSTTAGEVNADSIMDHVARAAGIGADQEQSKISILSMPFYQEPEEEDSNNLIHLPQGASIPQWVIYAGAGCGALLLILLLIIRALAKSRKKYRRKAEEEAESEYAGQPMHTGGDIMQVKLDKRPKIKDNIRDFVDENPEIASQMVRGLLRGGRNSDG